MLDFARVKTQINEMAQDQKRSERTFLERIETALDELGRWSKGWEQLADKVERSSTSWLTAGVSEPIDARYLLPVRPKELTVIATDGSQIFPDRHEVSPCYLVNIGFVVIHYGTGERPVLSSQPFLFYKEGDIYQEWDGRRTFMNREMLSLRRGMLEFSELASLSERSRQEGRVTVALSDGTLIQWMLEGKPSDFKAASLASLFSSFDRMRSAGVPVAGYISNPGSKDVMNALRVGLCPEEQVDCDRCSWKGGKDLPIQEDLWSQRGRGKVGLPCSVIEGVTDRALFSRVLRKGERTPLFRSASKILNEYGHHYIYFFYLHVGSEISRVEVPKWLGAQTELLNLVHACVYDQVEKGQGYPISLSEAHEKAVVRGSDREIFYRFLRDALVQHDLKADISLKNLRKLNARV